ncbi:Uncharacterised protein [BD1-7 clade bacterium]|uniref:Gp5/Type VI secretion system Vgr protein OB-fold domain-containing protein n=1 Tax=BD1-7 clade bacterium TaxID=2029982 RepID=A0A5S9Q467_9GAMM|nr:Uncharacterised protein [BD1-7 clade bacterium]
MSFELAELNRQLNNLIVVGLVTAVDHANKSVQVTAGSLETGWIAMPTEMGRNYRRWRPLRNGVQVIMASPAGDISQAKIIGMLYTDTLNSPSDNLAMDIVEFENGTTVSHNIDTHKLAISCRGSVDIESDDELTLAGKTIKLRAGKNGETTVDLSATELAMKAAANKMQGPLTQTGGDITSDGKSVQTHKHGGVTSGQSTTAVPQ